MKLNAIIGIVLLALASTAGNAGSDDVVLVIIKDFKFIPQEVTIKPGQTIRWENQEKRQYHSVWFEALGEDESDYLFPEESYERQFDSAGAFSYRCGPHPKMIGKVTVVE
jgi:plastocyanin